jgi:glycogen synthase
MRILMTADPVGGVWNYAVELCAALAEADAQVSLATLGAHPTGAQLAALAPLTNVTLFPSAFRLEWMPQPWEDLQRAGEWLLQLEERIRPDIVHLNHLVHADLDWRAPVVSVGHSCVLSWWAAVHGTPVPAEWVEYRKRVTCSLRAAQCVVAPSEAMLNALQRHYGPFHATQVIHNGRDRRSFNAVEKERFVLSAGRVWDAAKNVAALAAIAAGMAGPIVVAGELSAPHGARAHVPSVSLLGPLDARSLAGWYARAAVYALPARYEPFGLTALEAALSGCALVLGDIDSLREIWGPAARYVHPDRHADLRNALNELLTIDESRIHLSSLAMARARELTPARMAHRYLSLYRALCGRRTGHILPGRAAASPA